MTLSRALTGKRARKYNNWKHGFGVNSRGYTILKPDTANRIILVTGSTVAADANRVQQVTTLAVGLGLVRTDFGDWILLPAGGSTTSKVDLGMEKRGKSQNYPTVMGTFDPADPYNQAKWNKGPRFVFNQSADTTGLPVVRFWNTGQRDVVFTNLKWLAAKEQAGQAAISIIAKSDRLLFENCVFDGLNVIASYNIANPAGTSIESQADSTFNLDTTFNKCSFAYGNSKEGGNGGSFFAGRTRRLRLIDCIDHHGGWSRGHTRMTQKWQGPASVAISAVSSSGTTATALTSNTTGLIVGEYIKISGVTPTSYNGYFVVSAVNPGISFSYTFPGNGDATATGTSITYIRPEINGYSHLLGAGPNLFKHGLYVGDNCDGITIIDLISSWDASNPKLTGGNYYVDNLIQVRAPMGFITDPNGNDGTEAQWPSNSKLVFRNHMMIESADINDRNAEDRRGWCASLLAQGTGSDYAGSVSLRITTPTNGNRTGIDGDANGSPGPSVVNVRDAIAIETGTHFTKANAAGAVSKSLLRMITDNANPVTGSTNVVRTAAPAHMQAGITAALARNVHTTFRLSTPLLASVLVGATDLDTELAVCDYMADNPEHPWSAMLAAHLRSPVGR
jgi:hypothetical protein